MVDINRVNAVKKTNNFDLLLIQFIKFNISKLPEESSYLKSGVLFIRFF